MSYWIKHSEDERMPDWLSSKLVSACKICNSPMLNYYNDVGRCTNRKCSNDNCYGFVASKADFARKLLKMEGVGYAKLLEYSKSYGITNHLQLISSLYTDKIIVELDEYLRLHCFNGVDSEWERIVKTDSIGSLDELFTKYQGKHKELLELNKDSLYNNLQYVSIKEVTKKSFEQTITLNVMVTGVPNGYNSKEHFFNHMNELCSGVIVILHQKTKRQSNVHALIREEGSTTRGKVEAAIKGGIPIMTSRQFISYLSSMMETIINES